MKRPGHWIAVLLWLSVAVLPDANAQRAQRGGPEPVRELPRPKSYATDPVEVLDTHGIRLGMTLAEVREVVAKIGATVADVDEAGLPRNLIGGVSAQMFRRVSQGGPNYTGPRMDRYSLESVRFMVYPKDAKVDIRDDRNLIVFNVTAEERYPLDENTVFPYRRIDRESFLKRAKERFPQVFERTAGGKSQEQRCGDMAAGGVGTIERLAEIRSAGGTRPLSIAMGGDPSALGCGETLEIAMSADRQGFVGSIRVTRNNAAIVEHALAQLAQVVGYTQETKSWVEQQQRAGQ